MKRTTTATTTNTEAKEPMKKSEQEKNGSTKHVHPITWTATEPGPHKRWWWYLGFCVVMLWLTIILGLLQEWFVLVCAVAATLAILVTYSRAPRLLGIRTAQQATQLANKLDIENVEAGRAQIQQDNSTNAELNIVANGGRIRGVNGGDVSTCAAAIDELIARGQFTAVETVWNNMVTNGSRELMRSVTSTIARSKSRPGFIGSGDLQAVQEGNREIEVTDPTTGVVIRRDSLRLQDIAHRGAEANRYSPQKLAATSNDELDYIVNSLGGLDHLPANNALSQVAYIALHNVEIEQGIGNNRERITNIAALYTLPRQPTPAPQPIPTPYTSADSTSTKWLLDQYSNPLPPSQNNNP